MSKYIQLYQDCDKILNMLAANPAHRMMEDSIYSAFDKKDFPRVRSALHTLMQREDIKQDPNPFYLLIGNGAEIQTLGGYKAYFEREDSAIKHKTSLDNSTIDTNRSVRETNTAVQKNFKRNTLILWLTFVVASIGALATILTFITNYHGGKQEKLLLSQDSLKQQIQILQDSIKNKPYHLIMVRDTFYLKMK